MADTLVGNVEAIIDQIGAVEGAQEALAVELDTLKAMVMSETADEDASESVEKTPAAGGEASAVEESEPAPKTEAPAEQEPAAEGDESPKDAEPTKEAEAKE